MEPFDLHLWPSFSQAGGDLSSPAVVHQITIDSRRISTPTSLFVALKGGVDGHQFVKDAADHGARFALVWEGWIPPLLPPTLQLLKVKDPLLAFQEIAAIYRAQRPAFVIGITGSYGKTLLKELLYALLKTTRRTMISPESFNSQIGVPLSLLTIRHTDEIAIIEAGISRPFEMESLKKMIDPQAAILTTVGNAHPHTLKTLENVAKEKVKFLQKTERLEWALLPYQSLTLPYQSTFPCHYFWNQPPSTLPQALPLPSIPYKKMSYSILFPDGSRENFSTPHGFSYFLDLVNPAIQAAWLLGVGKETICSVLKDYQIEPMKTEMWKSPFGATFINAPYSSDPLSVDTALKHFQHIPPGSRKIFAFGGLRTQNNTPSDYKRIGKSIAHAKVDHLSLYGNTDFSSLIQIVAQESPSTHIHLHPDSKATISHLRSFIHKEDVVLMKGLTKESIENVIEVFHDSICHNLCQISLSAIQRNLEAFQEKGGPSKRLMIMVKASAYGTDDVRIAQFALQCGIQILGVSYVDEAIALRRAGVKGDLFAINAALYEAAKVVKWGLEVGVSDLSMIQALAEEARKQNTRLKVHLHVDTGMNRFGCRPEEALTLAQEIVKSPHMILEGLFTHFSASDNPDQDPFTLKQAYVLESIYQQLKEANISVRWVHAENSAALMRFMFPQFNMARIGLAIYGLYPSETCRHTMDLKLAISLISHIVGINHSKEGETISYGRHYVIQRERAKIAVLPIGYFDGLHRHYSGKSDVIIRGKKAPMVGTICMDYMMIDVSDIPDVEVGDPVLVFGTDEFGQSLAPEDLAVRGNSIAHELMTCLGPRIQRIFIQE